MDDKARNITGIAAILIAVFIIVMLFLRTIPDGNRDIAMVLLGSSMTWANSVFNFHFGSSDGSKRKDKKIKDMFNDKSTYSN